MITELTKIINNQPKTKKTLQELKNKHFKIIYDGALKNKSVYQIHRDLYNSTIVDKKILPEYRNLLKFSMRIAKNVKKIEQSDSSLLAIAILNLFMKKAVNYKANVLINNELRKKEDNDKKETLQNAFNDGRETKKLFYVASSHNDCAKDHLNYQGKVYIDEKWRTYVSEEEAVQIDLYIKNNGIKTVQWVTGEPVYFLTRPHCRHYFVQYTFDDIASMKFKVPYRKIGDRKYQTIANGNYEYYKDRYNMLKELYKTYPTKELKNLLLKTRILRDKWFEYGK